MLVTNAIFIFPQTLQKKTKQTKIEKAELEKKSFRRFLSPWYYSEILTHKSFLFCPKDTQLSSVINLARALC